ncbi:MAG TPA: hypothetical protein VHL34_17940 [Rhizomicrobium sp.]|nr:hypothetical protein [Rhizomicrobium sp.]
MRGLRRDIAGVLALKLIALAVLYFVFFAHAPKTTAGDVASHVMSD